jgi:hypothetical protein
MSRRRIASTPYIPIIVTIDVDGSSLVIDPSDFDDVQVNDPRHLLAALKNTVDISIDDIAADWFRSHRNKRIPIVVTVSVGDSSMTIDPSDFDDVQIDIPRHLIEALKNTVSVAIDDAAVEWSRRQRTRRANPPLSEHMAHDDLDQIASMLASRIAKSGNPNADFRFFVRTLITELYNAAQLIQDAEPSRLENTLDAVSTAMYGSHASAHGPTRR